MENVVLQKLRGFDKELLHKNITHYIDMLYSKDEETVDLAMNLIKSDEYLLKFLINLHGLPCTLHNYIDRYFTPSSLDDYKFIHWTHIVLYLQLQVVRYL